MFDNLENSFGKVRKRDRESERKRNQISIKRLELNKIWWDVFSDQIIQLLSGLHVSTPLLFIKCVSLVDQQKNQFSALSYQYI